MGEQLLFGTFFLLFEDDQWFCESRILFPDLFFKKVYLRVLATQAEDCGAGDVGIVDITSDQAAQGFSVLACTATSSFVRKELYAIHVFEQPCLAGRSSVGECQRFNSLGFAFFV